MFRFAQTADVPAHIELAFEEGMPVAVNGIAMSLPELNESLTTIAEDHEIAARNASPLQDGLASLVLDQARQALDASADGHRSGVVHIKLHHGEHTVVGVVPTALAHHS
jgi:argininosuccinate synthase